MFPHIVRIMHIVKTYSSMGLSFFRFAFVFLFVCFLFLSFFESGKSAFKGYLRYKTIVCHKVALDV